MLPPGRARLATMPSPDAARPFHEHHVTGRHERRRPIGRLLARREMPHMARRQPGRDGRVGQRLRRSAADRHEHVHSRGHELVDERGKAIVPPVSPAIFDRDVSAFLVPEVTQAAAKSCDEMGLECRRGVAQEADPIDLGRLLRLGDDRSDQKGESQRENDKHRQPPSARRRATSHHPVIPYHRSAAN